MQYCINCYDGSLFCNMETLEKAPKGMLTSRQSGSHQAWPIIA